MTSADEQANYLQGFRRNSNDFLASPDGAGIGLALAKAITEYHAGRLGFTGVEDKGSKGWIKLPLSGPTAG